jgi:hypothetical protein
LNKNQLDGFDRDRIDAALGLGSYGGFLCKELKVSNLGAKKDQTVKVGTAV